VVFSEELSIFMASRFTITLTIHHVYKAALNKEPKAVLLVTTCFSHLPAREAQHLQFWCCMLY